MLLFTGPFQSLPQATFSLQNQPQPPLNLPQFGPCPSARPNHTVLLQILTIPRLHAVLASLLPSAWNALCITPDSI